MVPHTRRRTCACTGAARRSRPCCARAPPHGTPAARELLQAADAGELQREALAGLGGHLAAALRHGRGQLQPPAGTQRVHVIKRCHELQLLLRPVVLQLPRCECRTLRLKLGALRRRVRRVQPQPQQRARHGPGAGGRLPGALARR
jgi:hypothetical protein